MFALLLFLGMLILIETGRRLAIMRRSRESEGERSSLGTVEGAVFALFGLLMAFTFSGAAGRFNEKRMLITEEVNCIETAYLRLQLVPRETELALQDLIRRYVDSRLETYHRLPNMRLAEEEMAKSKELQEEIRTQAVEATRLPTAHPDGGKLLLPALNNMIDIALRARWRCRSTRRELFTPFCSALGLSVPCSPVIGWQAARTGVGFTSSGFTVITVVIVYVVLDVEYPRTGLIRLRRPTNC
jgi:hypothetical protein